MVCNLVSSCLSHSSIRWYCRLVEWIMWHFTADLHISHPWMAGQRGFTHVLSHDRAMMEGWNNFVHPRDVVVICGDMFWGNHQYVESYWKALNGNKIMVKGNHDRWLKSIKIPYKRIYSKLIKRKEGNTYVVACHYPILSWNRKKWGALMLHGHCHGAILPDWNRMDIGVDVAHLMFGEYRPFSLEEVIYLLNDKS